MFGFDLDFLPSCQERAQDEPELDHHQLVFVSTKDFLGSTVREANSIFSEPTRDRYDECETPIEGDHA